jgi:hypothetical protein
MDDHELLNDFAEVLAIALPRLSTSVGSARYWPRPSIDYPAPLSSSRAPASGPIDLAPW